MSVLCSPFGPKPQFELSSGVPAVGNKLFFYVGGSVNTKQTTFTSSTGLVSNTNPIILDSLGQPTNVEIWFTSGQTYKVVYAPSTDTDPPTSPIWTIDNLSGINDITAAVDEWKPGPTPTFVSGTQFTLVGDQTTIFAVGRRVKATVTAGTVYGTITVSAFAVVTTVTVVMDSGALDAGLSAISYGLLSPTNSSIPSLKLSSGAWTLQTTLAMSGAAINEAQGANIASAATLNLDTATGNYAHVTGVTGITAITLSVGRERTVVFDGAVTITNSASLLNIGGANITTSAGATAIFRGEAAGVVRMIYYTDGLDKPHGFAIFTANNTWTVPTGVTSISVDGAASGGGGGGAANAAATAAGGGSGGQTAVGQVFTVVPGAVATITIGASVAGGVAGNNNGTAGNATSVTGAFALTLAGGSAGAGAAAGTAGPGAASVGAGSGNGGQGNNTPQLGGVGGGNQWAAPTFPSTNAVAGVAGNLYGGGGGGGSSGGGGATAGGASAAGFLRISW